jgi:signal transduction histidine kinase/CheY-like chemotaxis protein
MDQRIPFFSWSLKRLLASEPDSFNRSKLKILFTILNFSLLKIVIAMSVVFTRNQGFQQARLIALLLIYTALLKLMLSNRKWLRAITHVLLSSGMIMIWSIIFISAQTVNIVNVQFVFMLVLSSFYLLDRKYGVIYSLLGILPMMLYLLVGRTVMLFSIAPDTLASPAYEIIVVLNFITILYSHYLYHQAFSDNIAEKELLNAQLQAAVKEANRAAQSKSDFLSTMSHELRTPLNSVIGMTELLLDAPRNEEQAENLAILNFSAVSLHSLINDILDFNKMDSGKVRLECIEVDLDMLVKNICSGFRQQAKEKGLQLLLEIDTSISGLHVCSDPTRITQVIYNLVGNAIKFTSAGSVTVKLKEIAREEGIISIRFSVIDTGIGISKSQQSAIFEPFVQASTSTTREFGGTGLGLAIVKHLLHLFNSRIILQSTPGKGSIFSFELSLVIAERQAGRHAAGQQVNYDLSGLRVLIAEDNAVNRVLMKKVFAKWNNEPVFAGDGKEALEKLKESAYDVVLMDIHMPVMDGYEAARAIRQPGNTLNPGIAVIALTASVSDNLREKIIAAGMNDYICKPFNSRELYGKLKTLTVNG